MLDSSPQVVVLYGEHIYVSARVAGNKVLIILAEQNFEDSLFMDQLFVDRLVAVKIPYHNQSRLIP